MGMDNDFLLEDEDDEKTIQFIKNYLPQEMKDSFTDDDLYYILDVIVDYYTTSGCLDAQPDEEGYINIDQDEIVDYIMKEAKKYPGQEKMVLDYYLKNKAAVDGLKAPIFEEKIVDYIIGKANVADKIVSVEELYKFDEEENSKPAKKKAVKKSA